MTQITSLLPFVTAPGKDTNSLMNALMATSEPPAEIRMGDGATVLKWTDRDAGTVIEVTDLGVFAQLDQARSTDGREPSDVQSYAHSPNPAGLTYALFRVPSDPCAGQWRENGSPKGWAVAFGVRDQFFNHSF